MYLGSGTSLVNSPWNQSLASVLLWDILCLCATLSHINQQYHGNQSVGPHREFGDRNRASDISILLTLRTQDYSKCLSPIVSAGDRRKLAVKWYIAIDPLGRRMAAASCLYLTGKM